MATSRENDNELAAGASILSGVAAMGRLAPAKIYQGKFFVAAGATKIFCSTSLSKDEEGGVVGWWFDWQADDLETSPISLVPFSAQGQTSIASDTLQPPFTLPVPKDGFWLPYPFCVPISTGRGAGLQIKNNEATAFFARGWIALATWSAESRRDADDQVAGADATPWPSGTFKGGR